MTIEANLRALFDEALNLGGRTRTFDANTPLLGAIPELDSMGVVAVIGALEDQLGLTVDDDEIDGAVFETWGSLLAFVQGKLGS